MQDPIFLLMYYGIFKKNVRPKWSQNQRIVNSKFLKTIKK